MKINFSKIKNLVGNFFAELSVNLILELMQQVALVFWGNSLLILLFIGVVSLGLWLNSILEIRVTIRAVLFAIGFSIISLLIFDKVYTWEKNRRLKKQSLDLFFMNWQVIDNEISGPYCPNCNSDMFLSSNNIDSIIDLFSGKTSDYTYGCHKCDFSTESNLTIQEMISTIKNNNLLQE